MVIFYIFFNYNFILKLFLNFFLYLEKQYEHN
jgi:hypothetical protein